MLLYLPTQRRFLVGGKRVTFHGSNLTNSLGRTKLPNSLGNNKLNFRLARDQVVHLETAANLCAGQSAWSQKAIEVGQRFSLEKAFLIQKKDL